ncbi:MAG TPA: hypothetical protein VFX03_05930, partial [Thermomicrobiales bacterium]|nr:hypothetical protein [Thermomicrobiales bacterium]
MPLADLKLTNGEFPADAEYRYDWRTWQRRDAMQPRAALDGDGEIYVEVEGNRPRWAAPAVLRSEGAVAVRAPAGRDVTGSLYVPKADYSGMERLRFSIGASAALKDGRPFYKAKESHFQNLLDRGLPGAAWHRHQVRLARRANGGKPSDDANRPARLVARTRGVDDTFDLFTGGRAVRENLQLDRELRIAAKGDEMVDVAAIKGITIAEIDWKPLLADAQPALDPLASAIPADQHAVFFPSFAAALALSDEIA